VKFVLLHTYADKGSKNCDAEQCNEDGAQRIHVGVQNPLSPICRYLPDLLETVPELRNQLGGLFTIPKPGPEPTVLPVLRNAYEADVTTE
jgi:hypothetical protein